MHSATSPRARRGRRLSKLALSLSVLAALLVALEGAVRLRQRLRYGTFGQIYEFAIHEPSGLAIPVPGLDTGAIRINSLGFRGPEIERPKPAGRIRLAFLGGSTTYCAEASSNEATWPALVAEAQAEAFPGASFDYVNGGVGGYTVEQSVSNLRHRVALLEPDVILIHHATNDLAKDTRELAARRGVYRGHADEESALGEWSLAWYLLQKNLLLGRRREQARGDAGRLEYDPAEITEGFRRRLTGLVLEARRAAPVVALSTFCPRVRPEQTRGERLLACSTSLYYMPYMTPEGILAGFQAYNQVIREVAAATGALLIEAEGRIPADSDHYNDSVHFKDPGCRRMAALVSQALSASPAMRELSEGSGSR